MTSDAVPLRRGAADATWAVVSLGAALVTGATAPVVYARPLSLLVTSLAAGYVIGRWRQPRIVTLVAILAGGAFAVALSVLAWQNTGCSGECNDTTGNAQLRVLVAIIVAALMTSVWLIGATVGRRKARLQTRTDA